MQKLITAFILLTGIISCGESSSSNKFSVSGTIKNNTAKMIYLEEVPAETMQPLLVDSAAIGKDGKFMLKTQKKESIVYNLRLDQNKYPVASVINDAEEINLTIELSKENNEFADKYEVTGSPASQKMKDFMIEFNNDLQKIFYNSIYIDSLKKSSAADSVIFSLMAQQQILADKVKNYSIASFNSATDPALLMFELGYYQSTANGTSFGLPPLDNEHVYEIVSKGAKQFPSHSAIAALNTSLQQQANQMKVEMEKRAGASFVGKQAPDFSLPDVNGKEVKLSSYKGKYVLVDFWASWCAPCRRENPNLVRAYNQFRNKNFTVLGVSLDSPDQKDEWLGAIQKDGLPWTQVIDEQSSAASLYHVEGIPFNVLIDPDGKVIAEGLRGQQLFSKLAEFLK